MHFCTATNLIDLANWNGMLLDASGVYMRPRCIDRKEKEKKEDEEEEEEQKKKKLQRRREERKEKRRKRERREMEASSYNGYRLYS
ncbi:hypothetical protein M8J77_000768 [Diaphorina citri]|nr:hypothetical protein M8J77_000768 [Diaphorina citri]